MLNLTMSQSKVKEERHDEAEIREMAAKYMEAQKAASAKAAQQQQQANANRSAFNSASASAVGGQTNMMNFVTRKGGATGTGATAVGNSQSASQNDGKTKLENGDDKKSCDDESQRGHFGWATFGKVHIPYILRQNEKYFAVRMVELKLLNRYLSYLHQDIYSCTCVRSYYITDAESRLLNEINVKHCESQFGRELFTMKDLVVRMSDANKFYQFLDVCHKKLVMGNIGPSDKCGFIRINKESVVPYTVRENQQFVPLFYFEGETENLKLKAESLSGWDLSYLKFCCKVQGIRNELFASDSVAVISLTDIKSYFPTGTEFEEYWPSKVVETQLLIGASSQKPSNNSVHWTRQPAAPPPKANNIPNLVSMPKATPPVNPTAVAAAAARKQTAYAGAIQQLSTQQQRGLQAAAAAANTLPMDPSSTYSAAVQALSGVIAQHSFNQGMLTAEQNEILRIVQQQAQSQGRSYQQRSSQMVGRQPYQPYTANHLNMGALSQRIQQPPPLVPNATQNSLSVDAISLQRRQLLQQQHQQQQQQQQQRHISNSANSNYASLHPQISPQPAHQSTADAYLNGYTRVAEVAKYNSLMPPYKVHRYPVQNVNVICINLQDYVAEPLAMSVSDLSELFFRGTSLETCKRVLSVLGVKLYIGNRLQYQTLRDAGKNVDNIPLVKVHDVSTYMPQLSYMVQHQEQPSSKRARIS